MNIAFYINELNLSEENLKIYECLNEAIDSHLFSDASLFVNNINFMDKPTRFGIFNSTELWSYTGLLINVNTMNCNFTNRVVNKFKNCFCYMGNKENLFALLTITQQIPVFVTTEKDKQELFRLTGRNFPIIPLTARDIYSNIEVLYGNA